MKISAKTNAALWGVLASVTFAGIPLTLFYPGPLGPIPIIGSALVGSVLVVLSYRQWRANRVQVDFFKVFPMLAVGFAVAILLPLLAKAMR
ncbi:hypothetical protein [Burkholderia cenocepacia]|uniref:hypothetical protein n=1 Tax=Burkholderia cenocepacia TaxID=95486 RepID=UPI0013DF03A4|nr:hypothetical protein [Burkholderia cenocepacia]MCW3585048.1 hypothetical protein [Burkholderia cenocepacia]MCW3630516.1 hypothetical protein [Burkholderia cenocepacia]MCW5178653.1 hypothetical protein [Burkholderia cenocepacia]